MTTCIMCWSFTILKMSQLTNRTNSINSTKGRRTKTTDHFKTFNMTLPACTMCWSVTTLNTITKLTNRTNPINNTEGRRINTTNHFQTVSMTIFACIMCRSVTTLNTITKLTNRTNPINNTEGRRTNTTNYFKTVSMTIWACKMCWSVANLKILQNWLWEPTQLTILKEEGQTLPITSRHFAWLFRLARCAGVSPSWKYHKIDQQTNPIDCTEGRRTNTTNHFKTCNMTIIAYTVCRCITILNLMKIKKNSKLYLER